MNRETAKKMLITFGISEPSDEQITSYLNSVNSEVQKAKKGSEVDQDELERLRGIEANSLSDAERITKLQKAYDKAQNDAKNKEADFNRKFNRMVAESIFKGANLEESEYADFVDGIVDVDEEVTRNRATKLVSTLQAKLDAQKTSLEASFDEKMKDYTPNPNGGGGAEKSKAVQLAEASARSKSEGNGSIIDNYKL